MKKRRKLRRRETLPTQHSGLVVYVLMKNRGKVFTTRELAELLNLRRQSVWAMLRKLMGVLPIAQVDEGWVMYE